MVCTEPLPNERVPTRVARLWSCNAPATISEAEAEPPLIRTITGLPLVRSPGRALKRWISSAFAAAGGDDLALVQERIRNRNRLIEQAARIVAQIDDEPFDLVGAELTGARKCYGRQDRGSTGWHQAMVERCIDAIVGQLEPTGMAQHVRVDPHVEHLALQHPGR